MNLVRFGTIFVNFDRVATIRDLTAGQESGPKLVRIEFAEGHVVDVSANAAQLLSWVEQQATAPTVVRSSA